MCSEYLLMNDEKGTYKDSILKRIDELKSDYDSILNTRPKNPNWNILRLFSSRKSNV